MLPAGKLLVKSYYKTQNNFAVNSAIHNATSTKQPHPTAIRFVQKDYYGDEQKGSSALERISTPELLSKSGNWWSWTFAISMCPFSIFGFPSHHLIQSESFPSGLSTDTLTWMKGIFALNGMPFNTIVACILLVPTALMNGYAFYKAALVFNSLFITAQYEATLFQNVTRSIQYFLLVIPLDYVWLCGYKVRNMINGWNILFRKYGGVGCLSYNFRCRVALLIILIGAVFGIRYVTRLKYSILKPGMTIVETAETIMEFVVELGICLMLPLYCTFCYAVRFHLFVVKALIYHWIKCSQVPSLRHLNEVKVLYTHASDSILQINGWFYQFMSVVIPAIILETLGGSRLALASLIIPSGFQPFIGMVAKIKEGGIMESAFEPPNSSASGVQSNATHETREFNLEILGIVLMIGTIYRVIWQAIKTNDVAREIHLWLNDFVIGGAGVDVRNILKDLGVMEIKQKDNRVLSFATADRFGKINEWDGTSATHGEQSNGVNQEFLAKFNLLKAYIHVKMELEDSALMNIAIISLLKPNLSSRLGRYKVFF